MLAFRRVSLRSKNLLASQPSAFSGLRFFAAKDFPPHTRITMPALSPTMTSGNIGEWHKKIGDEISAGDVLVEIETDKAQMDFECQEEGFLAKILMPAGSKDVDVNHPIAVLVENKDDVDKFASYVIDDVSSTPSSSEPAASVPETKVNSESTAVRTSTTANSSPNGRIFASPIAKKIAGERGVELSGIQGTGPNGRIVKADVEGFQARAPVVADAAPTVAAPKVAVSVAPIAGSEYEDIPLTNMRKVIASRLQESKSTIPHYYLTVEIVMDKVLKLREVLNEQSKGAYKLSVNDFIIKAAGLALKQVPECNSQWLDTSIRRYKTVDISVAVSTPSGLITPIVKNADAKGLSTISNTVKDLATRARDNKLAPNEFQGGTFTISNLGMFGIKNFTAIINPPQSCILAVGSTEKKLVPDTAQPNGFSVVHTMHVSLSCDHRVVDGAVGAQWLAKFKEHVENPLTLML